MKTLIIICVVLAVASQVTARGRKPGYGRKGRQQFDRRIDVPRRPQQTPLGKPRVPSADRPRAGRPRMPTPDRPRVPDSVKSRIPDLPRVPGLPMPGMLRPNIKDQVNGILCDTCTELVSELEALLKSLDEDQIVAMLSGLCDDLQLPGNMSAECKALVQEYVPEIFDMIDSLDPKATCTELTLCTEEDVEVATVPKYGTNAEQYRNSLKKFKALDRLFVSVKERIQKNIVRRLVDKIFDDDVVCEGCKQTVQFIHDLLTNNETLSDIVSALEMVCPYLPEEFQKACDDYIELFPEVLITIANTYFMPDEDCQAVGLCPGGIDVLIPGVIIPDVPDIEILDPTYQMPELPELPQIPAAFEDMFTADDLETQINKHRTKLPSKTRYGIKNVKPGRYQRSLPKLKLKNKTKKLSQQAGKVADKYYKDIPDLVQVGTEMIPEITETAVKTNTNETWECSLCSFVVKTVSAIILKHKDGVAEAVIEATTAFCERLPEPYATKCTDEVSPFLHKFDIEFAMAMYLTPGKICPLVVDNCNP